MSKWLASVQSLHEAQTLQDYLPDILDMKNPSQGALGALSHQCVKDIVAWVNQRCLCSATVGDLPMQNETISAAITDMAKTGVDYVKVGLFNEPGLVRCIEQLESTLGNVKTPVIAVLFADQPPQQPLVPLLAKKGFAGVMLDTARKDGKGLLDHLSVPFLEKFVAEAKSYQLLCGLAGALRLDDIDSLSLIQPDYLGFRSALCQQHNRTHELDPNRARQIQRRIDRALPKAKAG